MKKLLLPIIMVFLTISACQEEKKEQKADSSSALDKISLPAKADFQAEMDGKKVELYHLRSAGIRAAITNYGGRLVSLWVEDSTAKPVDIVLGFNTLTEYSDGSNEKYHGATIGRYANRIAKGKFSLNGEDYTLAVNNDPNHLHGGDKGFESVVWDAVQENDSTLKLSYLSKDGEEGYPGNLEVVQYYKMSGNQMEISFEAKTDKATPVNLCNHAFFNLNGEGSGTVHKHWITIAADNFTPVDESLIPTGEIKAVDESVFDFREPARIHDRIEALDEQLLTGNGYDHNFVLAMEPKASPEFMARVKGDRSGIIMEMHSTEPGVQFYGGNFMNGSNIGKTGNAYHYRTAFCLEPQHFPDSPNKDNFPSSILQPEDIYQTKTLYSFSKAK
ncbi:MAG: aldose epimerase family protein [Bacteroidia bacterium]|nr:aldose epimerase family protein [Bacteroidia bacterium]